MTDLNHVVFTGNLAADPIYAMTAAGKGKCTARLGVDSAEGKDRDGNFQKSTTWYQLVAWEKVAELLRLLKKGMKIYVEGKQKERKYEKDGVAKSYIEITVMRVYPIDMAAMRQQNAAPGFSEEYLSDEPAF